MRRVAVATTIAATIAICVPLRAADSLVLNKFGDYLDALRQQAGIPGLAAAIVGANDIAWERAYGQQDVDKLVPASTSTPFHYDMVTQTVTAALTLQCVEQGRISLDDTIGYIAPGSGDATANATVRQILSHTTPSGTFSYQPSRLDVLKSVVEVCNPAGSFRGAMARMLDRFAMTDSVPGPDAAGLPPTPNGIGQSDLDRYKTVLGRLATPYAVDAAGHATKSQYTVTGLTAGAGLISTVRDYARFDEALKAGAVIGYDTLSMAWTPSVSGDRQLPHGLGWFVQSYQGEKVVWQFGESTNASSSLVVILPARSLTLVLLANSDGLSKSFGLASGDLNTSPFGKLFLGLFVSK